MILDNLSKWREKFIFCHQLKNFDFSENVFQIYSSIYLSDVFSKNPEKDNTGVLKTAALKTVIKIIQNSAKFLLNVRSRKCFLHSFALI